MHCCGELFIVPVVQPLAPLPQIQNVLGFVVLSSSACTLGFGLFFCTITKPIKVDFPLTALHLNLHVCRSRFGARAPLGAPQCCQYSCCNYSRNKFSTKCPFQLTTKSKRPSVIHLFAGLKNRKVHTSKEKRLRGLDTFTSLSCTVQTHKYLKLL